MARRQSPAAEAHDLEAVETVAPYEERDRVAHRIRDGQVEGTAEDWPVAWRGRAQIGSERDRRQRLEARRAKPREDGQSVLAVTLAARRPGRARSGCGNGPRRSRARRRCASTSRHTPPPPRTPPDHRPGGWRAGVLPLGRRVQVRELADDGQVGLTVAEVATIETWPTYWPPNVVVGSGVEGALSPGGW